MVFKGPSNANHSVIPLTKVTFPAYQCRSFEIEQVQKRSAVMLKTDMKIQEN